jgi:hypothetical protein
MGWERGVGLGLQQLLFDIGTYSLWEVAIWAV